MITCAITIPMIIGKARMICRLYEQNNRSDARKLIFELCQQIKNSSNNDEQRNQFVDKLVTSLKRNGSTVIDPNITFQYLTNVIMSDNSSVEHFIRQSRTSQIFDDPEEFSNIQQAPFKFLEDAYGGSSAKKPALSEQENNLIDVILFGRQELNLPHQRVLNITQLNENIRAYQEYLFQNIVKYFKYLKDNILQNNAKANIETDLKEIFDFPRLYISNGGSFVNSGQLDVLQKYIQTYLNLSPDVLTDLYNNTAYKNDGSFDKLKLDAYNSYVFLQNYDHFLLSTFGKSIQINDFGKLTGKDKYTLNKDTGRNTSNWNTDNMDVSEQADVLTKLVLNHTPYYKNGSNSPVIGKFISFQNFQHITGKIKSLYFNPIFATLDFKNPLLLAQFGLSVDASRYFAGKTFRQALAEVKYNYRDRIGYIYELLLNNQFYNQYKKVLNNLFTEDEFNILYSTYKEIYQKGTNSIFELSKTPGLFDMASYISSTAVDIYNNELVQFYRSSDNDIVARTLSDQSISNIKRQFEVSLQLWNMKDRFLDYDSYLGKHFRQITEETSKSGVKTIKFITTDGYTISYTPSTLNVNTMIDDKRKWELINLILNPLNLNNNIDFYNSFIQKYDSREQANRDLFGLAINILGNSYISAKYIESLNNKTDINNKITEYFGTKSAPKFNNKTLDFIHRYNTKTLQNLANTQADLSGLTTATLVKSGDKKNQNKQTLSRLFGSFFEQFELQDKQETSAVRTLTLLSNPNYFKGIFQAKEYFDFFGNTKEITDMNAAEMFFPMFITNYMTQYSPNGSFLGNGLGAFLISVNSDKPNISCMTTDLNAIIYNGKSINQMSSEELDQLISNDFGNVYQNIIENVLQDFDIFYNVLKVQGNQEIGLIWKNKAELRKDFFDNFQKFNAYCNDNNISPSNKMYELRREYEDIEGHQPINFIDQIHYYADKSGNICSNKTLISQLYRFKPEYFNKMKKSVTNGMADYKSFWKYKESELLQGILRYNIDINTIDSLQEGIKQLKNRSHPTDQNLENRWIDKAGDIIWAKYREKDGTVHNLTNQEELNNLINILRTKYKTNFDTSTILTYDGFGSLELHPELRKYNKIAYFNSQSFMLSTVGTFAAHPGKGKFANILEEEAARFNAQHKRNVSMTAAMHSFLLNTINGVPTKYNIAIIEDVNDYASTVHGETSKITAFDGATFVNPFMVILENNSLEGSAAGVTKKQFVHYYNKEYGTGGIIKTAGFGLTNDWIRNSPYLQRMMEKMTDRTWPSMINIMDSHSYYRGLDPKSLYKPIFFKRNGNYYTIDLNSVQMVSPYQYRYTVWQVAENGEPINGTDSEDETNIMSNYDLWKFFGGEYSMELKNGILKYSNISVEQVVTAMNEIGTVLNQNTNTNTVLTQDEVYQPLKHTDIHYIPTKGAVKFGGANINTVETFESDDQPLSTTKIEILQAGIQLDKEHHADDAEISLMTQVISACASLGYTYDAASKVYQALAAANINNTKEYYQGLVSLFNGDNSQIKELINKTLIEELANSKSDSIAKSMALSLQEKLRNGEVKLSDNLLPLSDNTIYAKLLSTINSFLTNSGIKSKIPGILSVLTTSFKINKLYAGKKYEQFDNPEQELEILQQQKINNPEFEDNLRLKSENETDEEYYNYRKQEILKNNPFAGLRFGTTYTVNFKDGQTIQLELDTIEKYQKLKKDVFSGNVSSFYENVKVGRNLAPYNSRFEIYGDGEEPIKAQLWDIDSINDLNRIKHAIKKNDIETINQIAQYYLSENTIKILSDDQKIKLLVKRVNARLQQDLLNLSTNVNQIYDQFKEAVQIFQNKENPDIKDLQMLQDKICILFRLNPKSNPIIKNGELDKAEFNRIAQQALNTQKVSIGRKYYNINKDSIQIEPYEVIMSKTFQSAFGLEDDVQLSDIVNDPLFFLKQYQKNIQTKVDDANYDIAFKMFNGKHVYIINRNRANFQDVTQIIPMTTRDDEGNIWRLDSNYNKMYQMNPNDIIYEKDGQEIIVTDNIDQYINNLNYDVIQFSRGITQNSENAIETLQGYLNLLKESNNNTANNIYNELNYELYDSGVFSANYEDQFFENVNRINTIDLNDITSFLYKRSQEKYNSFLTALNIVAARVPAQSMQSFMAMKIVAFENADVNTVYVNTMQLLLQGSDFDIDTVNLVTYDINNNGLIDLPSPFAKIDSQEHIRQSFSLPFPTGRTISLDEKINSSDAIYNILSKYRGLFTLSFQQNKDGSLNFENANININPEQLDLLAEFLKDGSELRLLDENNLGISFENQNYNIIFGQDEQQFNINNTHNLNIVLKALILQVVNKHNLYFNTLSYNKIERIVNNYSTANMIATIRTPINQWQGHVSVDGTTGPIKEIGNQSNNSKLVKERTAGNFLNQIESITDNQIGKKCIGICAVALKSFFATTHYCNTILNNGDLNEQFSLYNNIAFTDKNGRQNYYKVIANIRAKNVNSITNQELLSAIATAQYNEEDAAVLLSALLSLSTDNAKELTLAKLNAVQQMISLYLYGISIGIPFSDLANTIMSPAGDIVIKAMQGNMFTGKSDFMRISDPVFTFIESCEDKNLLMFNKSYLSTGDRIIPAYNKLLEQLKIEYIDQQFENKSLGSILGILVYSGDSPKDISELIDKQIHIILSNVPKNIKQLQSAQQLYALKKRAMQAVDNLYTLVQDPVQSRNYDNIKTLTEGASEIYVLGRLLGLNQGIRTEGARYISQLNTLRYLIYNKKNPQDRNHNDIIDIEKYCVDPEYRAQCVRGYEIEKTAINVLDVLNKSPHFSSYLANLAESLAIHKQGYKFRTIYNNVLQLSEEFKIPQDQATRGLTNLIGDTIINNYLQGNNISVVIDAGARLFTSEESSVIVQALSKIRLGNSLNNATFKNWVETNLIAELKERPELKDNKFIQDLVYDLNTRTTSHNPENIIALPSTMLPRTDAERTLFNEYKQAFNQLSIYTKNGIPLTDIFILYGMIVNKWKLSERSLVPLFQDFKDTGLINKFYKYETDLDASGDSLDIEHMDENLKAAYLAKPESPYYSRAKYIWYKDPESKLYKLMKHVFVDTSAYEEDFQDFDFSDIDLLDTDFSPIDENNLGRVIPKDWEIMQEIPNPKKFPTGDLFKESTIIKRVNNEAGLGIGIEYDNNGDIKRIQKFERKRGHWIVSKADSDLYINKNKFLMRDPVTNQIVPNEELIQSMIQGNYCKL